MIRGEKPAVALQAGVRRRKFADNFSKSRASVLNETEAPAHKLGPQWEF